MLYMKDRTQLTVFPGIGVDDMFILLSGLAETIEDQQIQTTEDRIAATMRTSGLAITITSLTDLLAFAIGASSVFVSVRNFCIYTGKSNHPLSVVLPVCV
jgi:hypothetical protein